MTIDEYDNNSTGKQYVFADSINTRFDVDCLKGVERLVIGNDCFAEVNRFVIDGLNELKSLTIGERSFKLDDNKREGSSV